MKKLLSLLIAAAMALSLCACNRRLIDTSYKFNKAYINIGPEPLLVDISSWTEDETTFTIITNDGTIYCSSQVNIILVKE